MEEINYRCSDGTYLAASLISGDTDRLLVLLHGGGSDHQSVLPLAERLTDRYSVVLPDIRGYGRSRCTDPARHTWAQYAQDVVSLLDHLDTGQAVIGGSGLGSTLALRTALSYPDRVRAAFLIGVEDLGDHEASEAETSFLDAFAERALTEGLEAAWAPALQMIPPGIKAMILDAIPRSDPASIVAAGEIRNDRVFPDVEELRTLRVPALVVPGGDGGPAVARAEELVERLPYGRLGTAAVSPELLTADDLARASAPEIREFLAGAEAAGTTDTPTGTAKGTATT